jgi:transposase
MIRDVIHREFGVTMSEATVGRWLKAMELSPQKPLYRAYQADLEAVEQWKSATFPKSQQQAKKVKATIYFTDEASVRSDFHAGTTWAPVGRTPVVVATGARFSVNMISAISAKGALRFSIIDGTLTATKFIDFCKRLLRDTGGPVFLILDGHPVHRSKGVTAFADSTRGELSLFRIPDYSPQLNPDEWVWENVKRDCVGRSGITVPDQFNTLCTRALWRLQRMPHLVRGFFADPSPTSAPQHTQSTYLRPP